MVIRGGTIINIAGTTPIDDPEVCVFFVFAALLRPCKNTHACLFFFHTIHSTAILCLQFSLKLKGLATESKR